MPYIGLIEVTMLSAMLGSLTKVKFWPMIAAALLVPLAVGGASAQGLSEPPQAVTSTVSKSDQEIIKTLQLAYRWGYPLMAMATNTRETYGSTINAFYNMKTATDETSQRDRGFNAETLYSAGALDELFRAFGGTRRRNWRGYMGLQAWLFE
jgi:hypothetical protein